MWQRVEADRWTDHTGLVVKEYEELPAPGAGQVRLRVECASASFTDIMVIQGVYQGTPKPPGLVPGYDLVGRVAQLGEGVRGLEVGDRVAALTMHGAYTQQIVLDTKWLVKVPEEVSSEDAVSLVLAWLTALQMLQRCGFQVGAEHTILVHGASGSVGVALTRLAKLRGARVLGTASRSKHDFCRQQGVDELADYREEDFVETFGRATCDAVFDAVSFSNFRRSLECVKPGGHLVTYGFYDASLAGSFSSLVWQFLQFAVWKAWKTWRTGKSIQFFNVTEMRGEHTEWFHEDLGALFDLCAQGKISPHIHARLPLAQAGEALRQVAEHEVQGKIVLTM